MWPFKRSPPRLVATATWWVRWTDGPEHPDEQNTVLFFEDAKGRRSYRFVRYGSCELFSVMPSWLGEIEAWKAGAPLPDRAVPVGSVVLRPAPLLRLVPNGE